MNEFIKEKKRLNGSEDLLKCLCLTVEKGLKSSRLAKFAKSFDCTKESQVKPTIAVFHRHYTRQDANPGSAPPFSSKNFTTASWPFLAARESGVWPKSLSLPKAIHRKDSKLIEDTQLDTLVTKWNRFS